MTLEELMPDPDRRDVALGGLAIVVEHADEIYGGSREAALFRRRLWLKSLKEAA